MILIDRLLLSGVRFVFDRLADVANTESGEDPAKLREDLLNAQMSLELGEITEEEFLEVETRVMAGLRRLREERDGGTTPGDYAIGGVDVSIDTSFSEEVRG